MRRVVASEFVSLDGVMESPEKWHFPYFDEEMGQEIGAAMGQTDAMLMGRVNYEEWAAFWPQQDPEENPAAVHMNGVRKYVVSTTLEEPLEWNNGRQRSEGGPMSVGLQYGSAESVGNAESECRELRREGFGVGVRKHSGSP